jgi:nifR3 family TIM-barrel protein
MLKIADIELKHPFILAPLAGISDLPMRVISRELGCEMAFIEMISVHAITHRNIKTLELMTSSPEDKPLGIQFLGRQPEHLEAAWAEVKDIGYAVVDLNSACPVKKVVKRKEGAALMREPDALYTAVKTLVNCADIPVTCKVRAGWDAHSVNAVEAAHAIEEAGASAIFIHGRTRSQQYSGTVDYEVIGKVKSEVNIPVIGSGDVFSARLAKRMLDETGCDGVSMARGAMGNPWIFRESIELLETGVTPPRPDIYEITRVMRKHLDLCLEHYGEKHAPFVYRKLYIWYTKGLRNVKPLRLKAVRATTREEHLELIGELEEMNTLEG